MSAGLNIPETKYAWNGDAALAYQVVGDGPIDLVYLEGYASHLDLNWSSPQRARFLRGLSSQARLIVTDRRGFGLSERYAPADVPPIEATTDDLLAVMDAAGSERAVIFAPDWSGFVATYLAAAHPGRVAGIALLEFSPTFRATAEFPWTETDEEWDRIFQDSLSGWATRRWLGEEFDYMNRQEQEWFVRWMGASNAPGAAAYETRHWRNTDVRSLLPAIQAPTLILADRDSGNERDVLRGRYLVDHIPAASLVEFDGGDQFHWYKGSDAVVREIGRFLAAVRDEESSFERTLATVLFTDIVNSTATAAGRGDRAWQELIQRHHATVRSLLGRYRGVEVDTAGDGFFATFDGPARAVRCAQTIVKAVRPLGIEVRAGVHTGEVETIAGKAGGIAVAIGSRIGAKAGASEVWASSTVKDLTAGSGLDFVDRGEHELKGVPDRWHLYAVSAEGA